MFLFLLVPNNVKINRQSTEIPTDSSTQQAVRRSPELNVRGNPNDLPTERTRISTSWVTASTSTTTQRVTTTRAPLRTSIPTRPALKRNPPVTTQAPNQRPVSDQMIVTDQFRIHYPPTPAFYLSPFSPTATESAEFPNRKHFCTKTERSYHAIDKQAARHHREGRQRLRWNVPVNVRDNHRDGLICIAVDSS